MLDDVGARPPIEGTRNPVANPTVPLPFPAEEVVRGLDAVIVTHRHRDHLDARGEELVPRDVPVFCQPEDEDALRRARPRRAPDRRRRRLGRAAHRPNACAPRQRARSRSCWHRSAGSCSTTSISPATPSGTRASRRRSSGIGLRVAVVNAGGAEFTEGGLIVMGVEDVREVAARVPTVVAVHLEALNHCFLSRATLRAAVPGVLVPEDGETLESNRPVSSSVRGYDPGRCTWRTKPSRPRRRRSCTRSAPACSACRPGSSPAF